MARSPFRLTAAALVVGHYPLRRAAYGESWGLLRYAVTSARRAGAFFGFWMLPAITPQLIVASRGRRWLAASVLAALMLAALRYRREIVLYLVEARPFGDAPEAFRQVLASNAQIRDAMRSLGVRLVVVVAGGGALARLGIEGWVVGVMGILVASSSPASGTSRGTSREAPSGRSQPPSAPATPARSCRLRRWRSHAASCCCPRCRTSSG